MKITHIEIEPTRSITQYASVVYEQSRTLFHLIHKLDWESSLRDLWENNLFVRGADNTPTTRTIDIPSNGLAGTSFIYEKLAPQNIDQA